MQRHGSIQASRSSYTCTTKSSTTAEISVQSQCEKINPAAHPGGLGFHLKMESFRCPPPKSILLFHIIPELLLVGSAQRGALPAPHSSDSLPSALPPSQASPQTPPHRIQMAGTPTIGARRPLSGISPTCLSAAYLPFRQVFVAQGQKEAPKWEVTVGVWRGRSSSCPFGRWGVSRLAGY